MTRLDDAIDLLIQNAQDDIEGLEFDIDTAKTDRAMWIVKAEIVGQDTPEGIQAAREATGIRNQILAHLTALENLRERLEALYSLRDGVQSNVLIRQRLEADIDVI